MALDVRYTAKTAMCLINVANTNLNGSGTFGSLLTGSANGTLVKSVIIKALGNTTNGMVRLFVRNGANVNLLFEIMIPQVTRSGRDLSFQTVIPLNYALQDGSVLLVSTEKAESFNVIAEGVDWFYPSSYTESTAMYTSSIGSAVVSTSNPNLDGTGVIETLITAASTGFNGLEINSIIAKAQQSTAVGMLRFYISSGGTSFFLFHELFVPAVTSSNNETSFGLQIITQGSFSIQSGYLIGVSTERNESFAVTAQGSDWNYL